MSDSMSDSVETNGTIDCADNTSSVDNSAVDTSKTGVPVAVFLVEDSPAILKNLTKSLKMHGDRVQVVGTAMSGEEAIREILRTPAQLVLLDLELPGIDGIEVTRRLKATVPQVDVLILTSFDDERKVYEAIQAGAAGYLVKRVSILKILDAIDEVRLGGIVLEPIIARRFWAYFDSIRSHKSPSSSAINSSSSAINSSSSPINSSSSAINSSSSAINASSSAINSSSSAINSSSSVASTADSNVDSTEKPFTLTPVEKEILIYIGKGLSNAEVGKLLSIDRRKVKTHLANIYQKMKVNTHVAAVVKGLQAGLIEL